MSTRKASEPPDWKVLNGATSQLDRFRSAPRPENVEIDGRSLIQLLAFGAQYGKLIEFYDIDNQKQGDWSSFYSLDPAIANAVHASLDLPEIEASLGRLLNQIRAAINDGETSPLLCRLIGTVVRLMGILDKTPDNGQEVWKQLARIAGTDRRDGLALPLKRLHRHLTGHPPNYWAKDDWSGDDHDWIHGLLLVLGDVVTSIIEELRHSAQAALAAVEASLGSMEHAPQAALYNAFVMLYDEARGEMNRFPRRLLQFYYADILKQAKRPAKPDMVFLTFTLAQGYDRADVPIRTLFSAGTDAQGAAINYAADTSLEVIPASVTALSLHRMTFTSHDGPGKTVTGVFSGVVDGGTTGGTPSQPFPLFGTGVSDSLTMEAASIGFVIADPVLTLWGGERSVTISLTPSSASHDRNGTTAASLTSMVQTTFDLYYSTAGGWMEVLSFSAQTAGEAITLSFDLPADAPPLVPLATIPAADAPTPTLPAEAFPNAGQHPTVLAKLRSTPAANGGSSYEVLAKTEVESVSIDVTVTGLLPETLSGPNGPLDFGQNFALFGTPPTQNAALTIYAPELFVKELTSLSVTVDWVGLPVTTTGFLGYYKGYVLDADGVYSPTPLFDNTTFQATLSVDSPGYWSLSSTPALTLFQTDTGSGSEAPLLPSSVFAATGVTPVATPPDYYNPSSSALLLTLVEPSYAFGNILYTSNLAAASTANIATLQISTQKAGTTTAHTASTQIANAASVNATATDKSYSKSLGEATGKAVSALNGHTLTTLQQAIAAADVPAETQAIWLQSLQTAITGETGEKSGGFWSWLTGGGKAGDASSVTARLNAWLVEHEGEFAQSGTVIPQQAKAALSAAQSITSTMDGVSEQSAAAARPTMAATLQAAQSQVGPTVAPGATTTLPNAPWLPTASSLTLAYDAMATSLLTPLSQGDNTEISQPSSPPPATTGSSPFCHLGLFNQILPTGPDGLATILPNVADKASLYIDLSAVVSEVSLLFVLQAGPDGWSTGSPIIRWEQQVGLRWKKVKVLGDSTNGLSNTGIVTLQLRPKSEADVTPKLRAWLVKGMNNAPYVISVTTNALTASWVGPGGASQLGTPLPAGTITQSQTAITGIGTIDQPEDSLGGYALAVGPEFELWMAERLRHKGFAIDAWDYARLVLASIPSLWQLAVVPATDAATGLAAPGHVWVIAVAGPKTPNISDPTVPLASPSVLAEIGEMLAPIVSPFVKIGVTNPPYLRLTVIAEIAFRDVDTIAACEERLQGDLIKWLSPWPDPALGYRPADYYTKQAIADFVNRRVYVRDVISLEVKAEDGAAMTGWQYLTSSAKHVLHGVETPAFVAPGANELDSRQWTAKGHGR